MNAREEAIADFKYIRSLGVDRLHEHFELWQPVYNDRYEYTEDDEEYQLTILEIQRKLGTSECLLEN